MTFHLTVAVAAALMGLISAISLPVIPGCTGHAMYDVTFYNNLTPRRFGSKIPQEGLVYSPLAAVSHSNRISLFTVRGFANSPVATLAKTGVNADYIKLATKIRKFTGKVYSVVDAGAPTMPGRSTTLRVSVDCKRPSVTVIGMIAPSPDWIVQINNLILFDTTSGEFVDRVSGRLIAYDTGVDSGNQFTPPLDLSLDIPTRPQKNIAPLVEDDTDRFMGRRVGRYVVQRVD